MDELIDIKIWVKKAWPLRDIIDYNWNLSAIITSSPYISNNKSIIALCVIINGEFSGKLYNINLEDVNFENRKLLPDPNNLKLNGGGLVLVDENQKLKNLGSVCTTILAFIIYNNFDKRQIFVSTCHEGSKKISERSGLICTGTKFIKSNGMISEVVAARVSDMGRINLKLWTMFDNSYTLLPPFDNYLYNLMLDFGEIPCQVKTSRVFNASKL